MAHPTPVRGLAPSSRLDDAARRILMCRLADVRHPESSVMEEVSMDGVHDMRVATRRLRAALQVFQEVRGLGKLERRVKRLQDALGEVRDLHVQRDWMAEAAKGEKPQRRRVLEELRAQHQPLLRQKEQHLRGELKRWTTRTVPALLSQMARLQDKRSYGGKHVRRHLRWRVRRVEQRIERYMQASDAVSAHVLRKELKKLRYELEIFQPALPRTMNALLEVLVPLQGLLGQVHDADVRLELFERTAAEAPSSQRAAALKLLDKVREERTQRAAEIARELQRWQSEQLTRRLRQVLH
jgi:CHAD domain-containing protein